VPLSFGNGTALGGCSAALLSRAPAVARVRPLAPAEAKVPRLASTRRGDVVTSGPRLVTARK
jgi:hypothetical protein